MTIKRSGASSKVTIVTGAPRGIGAAAAKRLAADGMTVVVNYSRSARTAADLALKIEQTRGYALTVQADISDPAAVARMFETTESAFGAVEVLVNNASVMRLATLADTDEILSENHVAVNLKVTFNTLREAARRLRAGGRIINVSSRVVGLY